MSTTDKRCLILFSGPIASGKTSVALALAARSRQQGSAAAAIDMDDLVEMIGGSDWSAMRDEHRLLAPMLAGKLVSELIASGYDLISVAGSTLAPYEWDRLLAQLPSPPPTYRVLLRVSVEESARRAQADTTRVGTKDAEVVRRHYDRIDWDALAQADIEIETDGFGLDEVVELVAQRLAQS